MKYLLNTLTRLRVFAARFFSIRGGAAFPSVPEPSKDETIAAPNDETQNYRSNIAKFEGELSKIPGAMFGDCFPLKHAFATGLYIREITMPKGSLLTSKIHKVTHPYFVLKGDVLVITEQGKTRIKAPYSGITLAGTKRALYNYEETVWVTVHKTDETDLAKIEKEIIAKDFDEIDNMSDYLTIPAINGEEVSVCLG